MTTPPPAQTQAPTKNQTKAPQQCAASEDPKSFTKQCTQLTNPENDTCCYGQFTCKDKTFTLNGEKCEKNITIYQAPICNTCDSNTHLLYKGKCTPKTNLGCCFNNFGLAQLTGYSCDMKTGKNCTLTTEDECTAPVEGAPLPTWALLGSIASTTAIPGIPKFSTTCSLDLSINYSPD